MRTKNKKVYKNSALSELYCFFNFLVIAVFFPVNNDLMNFSLMKNVIHNRYLNHSLTVFVHKMFIISSTRVVFISQFL